MGKTAADGQIFFGLKLEKKHNTDFSNGFKFWKKFLNKQNIIWSFSNFMQLLLQQQSLKKIMLLHNENRSFIIVWQARAVICFSQLLNQQLSNRPNYYATRFAWSHRSVGESLAELRERKILAKPSKDSLGCQGNIEKTNLRPLCSHINWPRFSTPRVKIFLGTLIN